ncbi:Uncharacterised protein [Mycobacteroides abscessus subsp. abscessus]|nr:Uncharacterised protein [Mycobacteroides abscessus subsp. abscessus]
MHHHRHAMGHEYHQKQNWHVWLTLDFQGWEIHLMQAPCYHQRIPVSRHSI